jgi:hypothetical protein
MRCVRSIVCLSRYHRPFTKSLCAQPLLVRHFSSAAPLPAAAAASVAPPASQTDTAPPLDAPSEPGPASAAEPGSAAAAAVASSAVPEASISTRLTACGSAHELRAAMASLSGQLHSLHYALICARCVPLSAGDDAFAARVLFSAAVAAWLKRPEAERTGRSLAGILDAAARLEVRKADRLLNEAARLAPTLSHPATAAQYLVAAASLEVRAEVARPLALAALRLLPGAAPADAHACLRALAQLCLFDKKLALPFGEAAAKSATGDAATAVNSLWAAARLGFAGDGPEAPVAAALVAAAAEHADSLDAHGAGRCLWALAMLGYEHGDDTAAAIVGAAERCAGEFTPQRAAFALWAAARLPRNLVPRPGPFVDAAVRNSDSFLGGASASALWGLAKLGVGVEGARGPLLAAATRAHSTFNAQHAADALWGAAQLGAPLCDGVRQLVATAARIAPSNHNPNNAVTALWAAASLGADEEPQAVAPLAAAVERLAPRLRPRLAIVALQAHFGGARALSDECVAACREIAAREPQPPPLPPFNSFKASVMRALRGAAGRVKINVPVLEDHLLRADFVVDGRVAVVLQRAGDYFWAADGGAPTARRPTPLLDRLFAAAGLVVVYVPQFEWELREERDVWLVDRLMQALGDDGGE